MLFDDDAAAADDVEINGVVAAGSLPEQLCILQRFILPFCRTEGLTLDRRLAICLFKNALKLRVLLKYVFLLLASPKRDS